MLRPVLFDALVEPLDRAWGKHFAVDLVAGLRAKAALVRPLFSEWL